MILVDWQIKQKIENGELIIDPFFEDNLSSTSYDVTLSNHFVNYIQQVFDPRKPPKYYDFTIQPDESVLLLPHYYTVYSSEDTLVLRGNNPPDIILDPEECNLAIVDDDYAIFTSLLATTTEYIELPPYISAEYTGRSSLGRLFLQSHQTAGWIDAGFSGQITLELKALEAPVLLYPGMKIGQLIFYEHEKCQTPYNRRKSSKYGNQVGATPSRLHLDYSLYKEIQ